jgi:NIMA-interacting peptidyl-prolyl cis-trans isomerase 1
MSSSFTTKGLPFGWKLRESKSRPGVVYYITPSGKSQWTQPSSEQVAAARRAEKQQRQEQGKSQRKRARSASGGGRGGGSSSSGSASSSAADGGGNKRAKFSHKVRASHILVKHVGSRNPTSWRQDGPITRTEAAAQERLAALRKRIVDDVGDGVGGTGDADARRAAFAKVAEAESDCSSHKHGGNLRFFTYDRMDPPFSAASFALEPFAISGIVRGASGLHIILRTDDPSLPSEVQCLHLLKKHSGSRKPSVGGVPVTRTKESARAELTELLSALEGVAAGDDTASLEAMFRECAKSESDCSSARNGGDLGLFGMGKMQPPFEAAAFALKVGGLSALVESPSGVHIIMRIA